MSIVIITGGGGGIGLEIARASHAAGWKVFGLDIIDTEEVRKLYEEMGGEYIKCDITVAGDRAAVLDRVRSSGNIKALINTAGVAPKVRTDLLDMGEESYDRVMNINTKALFFFTKEVARSMIAQSAPNSADVRGYIINISSMSAYTSSVSRGEYCISKAGVSMITKLFADRLSEERILVNEVRPGIIATPMTDKVKDKYDALINGGLLPLKRWGQPCDVAKAVLGLMSGWFDYTTGQSIDVDGGFHLRRL